MSGTLFLISTPIGNLEDITLRALRLLREADVIAAEDTRRTGKLLAHYAINTPTLSFHQHNTRSRLPQLLERLKRGEQVALVTDAGTPGISDPGTELVEACLDAGIAVDPAPGASAPLAAATASGFPLDPLTIFGFVPVRGKDRKAWFERIQAIEHTVTFFEAPHRIRQTLTELGTTLGDRPIFVGRELSKVHQQFLRGPADSIIGHMTSVKGEFTVVIGPNKSVPTPQRRGVDHDIVAEFGRSTEEGSGARRQAVVKIARKYGRSAKDVYNIIERAKGPRA